ncbi:MAG: hypothetical protein IPJ24_15890 [bacterium]|nr:hypothetical protein [bacterium]
MPVVLATTDHERDDPLVAVANAMKVAVVRGPEHDVLGRFLLALDRFPARWVARVCGDSPLFDPCTWPSGWSWPVTKGPMWCASATASRRCCRGGEVVSAAPCAGAARPPATTPRHRARHGLGRAARTSPPELMVTAWAEPPAELVATAKLSVDTADDLARMRRLYAALWDGGEPLDLRLAAAWLRAQSGGDA